MWSDLRFAARILRKSPLFAVGVMSLVALGIAANIVMFSLVGAVLLRALPVRDPDSLLRFVTIRPPLPTRGDFQRPEFEAWQKQSVASPPEDPVPTNDPSCACSTGTTACSCPGKTGAAP